MGAKASVVSGASAASILAAWDGLHAYALSLAARLC